MSSYVKPEVDLRFDRALWNAIEDEAIAAGATIDSTILSWLALSAQHFSDVVERSIMVTVEGSVVLIELAPVIGVN